MLKIVADKNIPFLRAVLDPYARVDYCEPKAITADKVRHADALIIRTRTTCNRALLEGSKVRFIATATIGHEHIDKEYCRQRGIQWSNAPGCNAASVAQYILSALLYLYNEKKLDPDQMTLGIIGVGNVGKRVARMAEILGLNTLLNDPPRQETEHLPHFVDLDRLVQEADVLSFHVPLERDGPYPTWHMVDREFLERIQKGSVLINTSRGAVFNNEDLFEYLRSGDAGPAVLDVWENEPYILKSLLEYVSIGTAHIAGYSTDGKANGTRMSIQALAGFFDLPLKDWCPENIPPPEDHMIIVDGTEEDRWALLYEIVRKSYDVSEDHRQLVQRPSSFERLRENYPVRREFPAYAVRMLQDPLGILPLIDKLGFELAPDHCF